MLWRYSHPISLSLSLAAFNLLQTVQCTHLIMLCCIFYSGLCCHKIQLSGAQLHLVVNLLDCFMAQRQIASQPKNRKQVLFSGCIQMVSIKHDEAKSMFVCVLVANDPSELSGRKLNGETRPYSFSMGCVLDITCVTN